MKQHTTDDRPLPTIDAIIADLRAQGDPARVAGMARYAIRGGEMLGISMPWLRAKAKEIGKNHDLALELWETGIHEARILAGLIDVAKLVTEEQMDRWVCDFDSWDVVDGTCGNLFDKTPHAWAKAAEWCHREEEYVRRAGFVMMAELSAHDKRAADDTFLPFFPLMLQYADDNRNFVKKAVNWALREIGGRNAALREQAIATANAMLEMKSSSAKWIARDALRELNRRALPAGNAEL